MTRTPPRARRIGLFNRSKDDDEHENEDDFSTSEFRLKLGRVRSPSGPESQSHTSQNAVASEMRPYLPRFLSGSISVALGGATEYGFLNLLARYLSLFLRPELAHYSHQDRIRIKPIPSILTFLNALFLIL